MKTVGIVVEYNPLHNGHVLHYERSKALTGADAVVAVMSGPFLQRGEPAIASKRARAEMALRMGADLVIELPVAYAVQPAEWFAHGAVALLAGTGVVDSLCFGSESGTLEQLLPLARLLARETEQLQAEMANRLQQGDNFPAAYAAAAAAVFAQGEHDAESLRQMLARPNNSLGLHYLIALERLKASIKPYTIPRESAQYHDQAPGSASIASATAIRRLILTEGLQAVSPYIPEYTLDILEREMENRQAPMHWERFRQPLLQTLLTRGPQQLETLHEVTEGLEFRIRRQLPRLAEPTVEALLDALKTKRYTRTKLQRMLVHVMLNHGKAQMSRSALAEGPGYLRILGFSSTGRALLKRMKKTASLPVVMKPSAFEHPQLDLDLRAAAVYAAGCPQPLLEQLYSDYLLPPITI